MKIIDGGRLGGGRDAIVEGSSVELSGRAPSGIGLFKVVEAVDLALAGDGVRLGIGETPVLPVASRKGGFVICPAYCLTISLWVFPLHKRNIKRSSSERSLDGK